MGGGGGTASITTPQIFPNPLETATGNAVLPKSPPVMEQPAKKLRPLVPKKQDGQITLNVPQHHLVINLPEVKRKSFHPPTKARPLDPDEEDDDKKKELLERNRLAAKRSRIKRKTWTKEVVRDNETLRLSNRNLQAENTALKEEVARLHKVITTLQAQKVMTINHPSTIILPEQVIPKVVTNQFVAPQVVAATPRDILSEATLAAQLQGTESLFMPPLRHDPVTDLAAQAGSSSGFVRVTPDAISVLNTQPAITAPRDEHRLVSRKSLGIKGSIDETKLWFYSLIDSLDDTAVYTVSRTSAMSVETANIYWQPLTLEHSSM